MDAIGDMDKKTALRRLDRLLIELNRRHSMRMLRVTLAFVFVWFGALKIFDVSPAADLVAKSLPFMPARAAVLLMGLVELAVGLALLSGWAIRVALVIFFAQMVGTLLMLVLQPGVSFEDGNPLQLSLTGEFIVKNLVLITAGLVIVGAVPKSSEDARLRDLLTQKPDRKQKDPTAER
jgi:putative oxidoreductase